MSWSGARSGAYYLYLIRCADGTYYTGSTKNLALRLRRHEAGRGAKYVRGRGPVRVVYVARYRGMARALQAEWNVKRLTRTQKECLVREAAPATRRLARSLGVR